MREASGNYNSKLAQIHDYIHANSVDERKNAVSANQSSNSTKHFAMMSSFFVVIGLLYFRAMADQ